MSCNPKNPIFAPWFTPSHTRQNPPVPLWGGIGTSSTGRSLTMRYLETGWVWARNSGSTTPGWVGGGMWTRTIKEASVSILALTTTRCGLWMWKETLSGTSLDVSEWMSFSHVCSAKRSGKNSMSYRNLGRYIPMLEWTRKTPTIQVGLFLSMMQRLITQSLNSQSIIGCLQRILQDAPLCTPYSRKPFMLLIMNSIEVPPWLVSTKNTDFTLLGMTRTIDLTRRGHGSLQLWMHLSLESVRLSE